MTQVFISHDTESDGKFAQSLAKDLEDAGVEVWIAPNSIRPGEQWIDAVSRGLETSTHFTLVSTPKCYQSPWVRKEYNAALLLESDGEIEVIPLQVKKAKIPLFLRGFQLISFLEAYEKGFQTLANLLGVKYKHKDGKSGTAAEPAEPAIVTGHGAVAQGAEAMAAGAGGVFVGGNHVGNINTGPQIYTGGGAYVSGDVSVAAGRDFVGRDKIAIVRTDKGKEPRIFLAYDVRDKEYAHRLAHYLGSHGINKWMAPGSIEFGTRWDVAIVDAIVDSAAMVVIMSPHSSSSRWVQQELRVAEREAIPIYPILLSGTPFEYLSKFQCFDARDGALPPDPFIRKLKQNQTKA